MVNVDVFVEIVREENATIAISKRHINIYKTNLLSAIKIGEANLNANMYENGEMSKTFLVAVLFNY